MKTESPANLARDLKREQARVKRQMSRLALVLVPFQALLKHEKVRSTPAVALQGARGVLGKLQALENECKPSLKGIPGALTHSMHDATKLVPVAGAVVFVAPVPPSWVGVPSCRVGRYTWACHVSVSLA